jgi:hypothetical protein
MKKIILFPLVFLFAFAILVVSIFNSSSITYSFYQGSIASTNGGVISDKNGKPLYIGTILPDNPFWVLKDLRDKIWLAITPSHSRKAEIALLFADKRILMTEELFKEGKFDVAIPSYIEGEKYLSIAVKEEKLARTSGVDTDELLTKLALSIIKHQEIIESLIYLAPEDLKETVHESKKYSTDAYNLVRDGLNCCGLPIPKNPFDGEKPR